MIIHFYIFKLSITKINKYKIINNKNLKEILKKKTKFKKIEKKKN